MPNLRLTLDRPLASLDPSAPCHLVARVNAPVPDAPRELPPLDLSLVLDASGSMSGAPLAAAHEAVLRIADELPADTRLAVVSFADDIVVHVDGVLLDGRGRALVKERLADLRTRGSTNLHAGWQAGGALLDAMDEGLEGVGRRRRVVVLSDGCANQGIVAPDRLAPRAKAMLERGIATSCVGVGDHYSPHQLMALAEHGGGSCHDAKDAAEIVEILRGEVRSLASVVAEDLQLKLSLPEGVCATELSGMPCSADGQSFVVHLGALREGVERVAAVRLEDARALPGSLFDFVGDRAVVGVASWRVPGEDRRTAGAEVRVVLERSYEPCAPALADAREVLEAWQAGIVRRVTDWNRDAEWQRIDALWRDEFAAFLAYAAWHPETRTFADTIRRVRRGAAKPMPERARKAAWDMASKMARKESAMYAQSRGPLVMLFGEASGQQAGREEQP